MEYLNKTLEVICKRASLRNFSDKEIPEEVLNQVLRAGVESASGGNLQPYTIIKITDKEKMKRLVEVGNQAFIADAPVNLLFCIDWNRTKRICELEKAPFTADKAFPHFWISFQDTIIAAQSVCTAADSVGLGSVYIGTVPQIPESLKACKEMFNLPKGVFPVVMVTMGYPSKEAPYTKKFKPEVMIHENGYNELSDEELLEAVKDKYDGKTLKIVENDKRVDRIIKTSSNCMGAEYTEEIRRRMEETGFISVFQYRFGLHYSADFMPTMNIEQMNSLREMGFDWFDEFIKPE